MEGMCENGEKENGEKENKGMMVAGTGANTFYSERGMVSEKKKTLSGG